MKRKFQELQEGVDKLLECPVCLEQFKQPKMLKCQHSFCLEPCLKNMAKSNLQASARNKYSVECAICRKKCSVDDLNNIPDNLSLKNFIELRKQQPQPDELNETGSEKNGIYCIHQKFLFKIILADSPNIINSPKAFGEF